MKSYILEAEESHHLLQLLQAFQLSGTKIPHTLGEQNRKKKTTNESNEVVCWTMPYSNITNYNYYYFDI